MKSPLFTKLIVAICLTAMGSFPISTFAKPDKTDSESTQVQVATVVVGGRSLVGPNSTAQRRAGRIFVPVSAIARALGDVITIDAARRAITVRRQTGVDADFDARSGQVRENGAAVLSVSNAAEIVFTPNIEALLFPAEIAASLFDIAIRYDSDKNAVLVDRGHVQSSAVQSKIDREAIELYQLDYEYNLNQYGQSGSHNLILNAVGRLADGRFSLSSNSGVSSGDGISIRRTTFTLDRPNGQRFVAGDFGTGGSLQFLSSSVRGGSASFLVGDSTLTAFAGRTYSGVVLPFIEQIGFEGMQNNRLNSLRYDTNVYGFFATTKPQTPSRSSNPFIFSAGAMRFGSDRRSGEFATGSVSYDTQRLRLQADTAFGNFDGFSSNNLQVNGYAAAVDVSGTYLLREDLVVQGRYTSIGRNFLSPQSGIREPLDLKAVGMTWSPTKWLSTSVNASTARRPGDNTQNNKFVTASFTVTPSPLAPRFYFSHTESSTSQVRSSQFTTFNAAQDFRRFRIYLGATRIKNFGAAAVNAQIGASFAINDKNSVEVNQGMSSRGGKNGQLDWRTTKLFNNRLGFSAGLGYTYAPSSGISKFERLSASLNLPKQTTLQVNYYNTSRHSTLLVSLRGSLFNKRESESLIDAPLSNLNSYGKVSGRVYQDINQNGEFDEGIDKPQVAAKVRVDGNRYVESDENGFYKFDSVNAGDHRVYLDLLSVRADLTLLGESTQDTRLVPGHSSTFDFRLVRTGRITGRVWLDTNENGKFDEGETPLPDVRVVTASGRDTLTDIDGVFTIGDLAPGEHTFFIDEKTLPEKTVPARKPIAVQAFPGRVTSDVFLTVIPTPAEIKRFSSKPN